MNDILTRIQQISAHEGITIAALERQIGASKGVLSRAIANGTDIQAKWLKSLVDNYPRYSPTWLLTGDGSMLKPTGLVDSQVTEEPQTQYRASKSNKPIVDIETRPRIPLNAMAGALSFALDGGTINDCEQLPVIRAFPRYDFTILINGESMEPQLHSGDELACLNVKTSTYIQWGRMHVLDTDQGIVVKRVFDNGESIICRSDNKMFSEYIVPKESVYNIALVVGMLRRY